MHAGQQYTGAGINVPSSSARRCEARSCVTAERIHGSPARSRSHDCPSRLLFLLLLLLLRVTLRARVSCSAMRSARIAARIYDVCEGELLPRPVTFSSPIRPSVLHHTPREHVTRKDARRGASGSDTNHRATCRGSSGVFADSRKLLHDVRACANSLQWGIPSILLRSSLIDGREREEEI